MVFRDRLDAGRRLGEHLASLGLERPVVFALPRGGVPVAYEVARALNAPLEVLVARKLGVPHQPELGFGAIAEGGVIALNERLVAQAGVSQSQIEQVAADESAELDRRVVKYRGARQLPALQDRTAVLVDDGLATGYTARAGIAALRHLGAERVVLAVPVGAPESVRSISDTGCDVVCLHAPEFMMAVGEWYSDFTQTSDGEVIDLLSAATGNGATGNGATGNGATGNGATGNGATGNGATGNGATGNGGPR